MFSSRTSAAPVWGNQDAANERAVHSTLAKVQRLDRWIFSHSSPREINFQATLERLTALFESITGAPAATNRTLAKVLAAGLLIAIGCRSSPVWLESALLFRSFVRLCWRVCSDGRYERRFLRDFTTFQRAFRRCHMLTLRDASHALSCLQGCIDVEGFKSYHRDVEQDLRIYMSLPQPSDRIIVEEKWPGPSSVEWQDASLMTWLYGQVYDQYAEAVYEIATARSVRDANRALRSFADSIGVEAESALAIGDARHKVDELMQRHADLTNQFAEDKEVQGPKGSGSIIGYASYVKNRDMASDVTLEYFVNTVCQFPSFEASRYLPEAMKKVALAMLRLQVQLFGLIDASQLSDTAHELYVRLDRHEEVLARGPIDSWMNDVVKLYVKFEESCGPAMKAVCDAVRNDSF